MNQNIPLYKHFQSLTGYVTLIFWLLKPLYKKGMKDVLCDSFMTELQIFNNKASITMLLK